MAEGRESFSGRFAVIMALAGSAIGLGNIWRFPFMLGEGGGAAFIIVYIIVCALICLPIMMCEAIIGRSTHLGTFGAIEKLAPGTHWKWLGLLTVVTPLLMLSYYSVIGGWSVGFLGEGLGMAFTKGTPDDASALYNGFIAKPLWPLLCHTVFIVLVALIVLGGVNKGIEKFSNISMPVLFLLIVIIAVYSVTLPGAGAGVRYLLHPDFSKLTGADVMAAMGQAFFSLSLGDGATLTYFSYVRKNENIMATGAWTAGSDLLFAIIAGFAVMPAVFAAGLAPEAGPGLIFQAIPYVFAKMGLNIGWLSDVMGVVFFLMVLVAALTSAISMMEVGVAFLQEQKGFSRKKAVGVLLAGTWALGCVCSLSFGPFHGIMSGGRFFDLCDALVSNYMMPFGGLLFAILVGWKLPPKLVRDEFTNGGTIAFNTAIYGVLRFIIKWVVPVAIVAIFVSNLLL